MDSFWQCPTCKTTIDSQFQVCWNCGTSTDGDVNEDFAKEIDAEDLSDAPEIPRIQCRKCDYRGKVLFSTRSKNFVDWIVAGLISISISQRSWIQFCHQICPKCDAPQSELAPWAGKPSIENEQLWESKSSKEERFARKQRRNVYVILFCVAAAIAILAWAVRF